MPNKFTIEIRDAQYERIGIIERYNRFEAIVRFCDIGTWTLVVDATTSDASLLQKGGGIVVWSEGMTEPLFSGPLKYITRSWSIENPGGLITFTGKSDECWLYDRIIYPNPTLSIEDQDRDRDWGSITAGGALNYFTRYNLGPSALTERQHPYLEVDNDNTGPVINVSARFDVLGEYLQKLALSSGYAYKLFHDDDHLRFKIFKPTDRTGEVIFSPDLGNMSSYDYSISAPTANVVIVAAQGEGKKRWIERSDAETLIVRHDDSSTGIDYTGTWSHDDGLTTNAHGGTRSTTSSANASIEFSFSGERIQWYGVKSPAGPSVDYYLDGVYVDEIQPFNAASGTALLWDSGPLEPGTHTVKFVNIWAGEIMNLDYFAVHPVIDALSAVSEWGSMNPEKFVDRRDIPIARDPSSLGVPIDPGTVEEEGGIEGAKPEAFAQLDQAAYEALIDGAGVAKLSVTPIDTERVKFGRDYNLGDKVTVSIDGVSFSDVLREIRLTDSLEDGATISPLVGTDGATETPELYKRVRELETALRQLEARL